MAKHKKISKPEIRWLIASLLLMFFVFFLLLGWLEIRNFHPYLQFVILTVGISFISFSFVKGWALKKRKLADGMFLGLFLWLATDLIAPEYHVSKTGELIVGGLFGKASTDYVFGYFWSSLGITGAWLYTFTYIISFSFLAFIAIWFGRDLIKK